MNSSSLLSLRKFVAPEIVFGAEARLQAGRYARNIGVSHALLVSDPGVAAAGWTGSVQASLADAGVRSTLFTDVTQNPKSAEVMNGAGRYHEAGCDGIVAVGGGSPMDCAKGIGIVAANGGNVLDYEGVDEVRTAMPPLICLPTTAGSAADVSQFTFITSEERKNTIAIISKSVVPDIALIDFDCTQSLGADLTACTGMDALAHAIEASVSNAHSPLTDLHALDAIRLIAVFLRRVVADRGDTEARRSIMLGCLEAGLAFSNSSLGAVHSMALSLGSAFDLPHSRCSALLLDKVILFNYPSSPERYDRIGLAMGVDPGSISEGHSAELIAGAIVRLRESVGVRGGLADLGITVEDLAPLARKAIKDPCLVTNPREASIGELKEIYERAL